VYVELHVTHFRLGTTYRGMRCCHTYPRKGAVHTGSQNRSERDIPDS
jgi:hypothetical protein